MNKGFYLILTLFLSFCVHAENQSVSNEIIAPHRLISMMKDGGLVVYFRHGITDRNGEKTVANEQLEDCSIQRNLSPEGVRQTKAIGDILRNNRIKADKVLSSPYCRCLDTATNLFGKAERSDFLYFAIHLGKKQREVFSEHLQELLSITPASGSNTILVSHSANLKEAVDIWPKEEGEAHVFKPDGNGGYRYLGKISPSDWLTY